MDPLHNSSYAHRLELQERQYRYSSTLAHRLGKGGMVLSIGVRISKSIPNPWFPRIGWLNPNEDVPCYVFASNYQQRPLLCIRVTRSFHCHSRSNSRIREARPACRQCNFAQLTAWLGRPWLKCLSRATRSQPHHYPPLANRSFASLKFLHWVQRTRTLGSTPIPISPCKERKCRSECDTDSARLIFSHGLASIVPQ